MPAPKVGTAVARPATAPQRRRLASRISRVRALRTCVAGLGRGQASPQTSAAGKVQPRQLWEGWGGEEPISPIVPWGKLRRGTDLSQQSESALDRVLLIQMPLRADREAVLDKNGIDEFADGIGKIGFHRGLALISAATASFCVAKMPSELSLRS